MPEQSKKTKPAKKPPRKAKNAKTAIPDADLLSRFSELLREAEPASAVALSVPAGMQDEDLLCVYEVRVLDYGGATVLHNAGTFTLSGIGDKEALPEAPALLQSMFWSMVWRPVRNRFMRWINGRVGKDRPLPEIMGETLEDNGAIITGGPLGG